MLAPGTRIGPHEIVRPLGAGGMGEVYLARDTRLDREVALKLLPPRMADDAEAIARFRREALTLASLNHPNIATVFGFEEVPRGPMALVLERVEGETLAERLRRGALAVTEAVQIGAQIAHALEVAHEHGVIHRDVKPANVMIGPRGLVKVLDFGLARRAAGLERLSATADERSDPGRDGEGARDSSGDATRAPYAIAADAEAETIVVSARDSSDAGTVSISGMTVGTPGYMSPEQVRAEALDARTDVFALGCVLYECLTGRRAFAGRDAVETMKATLDQPVDTAALPDRTPARVRALLDRCLAKDPAQRVAQIRDVRLELEDVLGIRRAGELREGRTATPSNLPVPVTDFVGRTATLEECAMLLERVRLLSLVGIGGSGKTRLALRLAERRLDDFPDGVWFVDVAPLNEPGRVVEVLAAAIGVPDEPGRTLMEGLGQTLATQRALVLLDNAETHAEACARIARHLLATGRQLKLLLTSREPLGIDAETVYTVPALGLPDAGVTTAAEALNSEAVRLFVERARLASPDFELDGNVAAVVEICRRLDGIPLALELAAARVRLLGVEQIRARLDDRFRLLTRGAGAPSRQQAVLATIQWSFDHLLPPEQEILTRLAVFTGGWTLGRAAVVCSDSADEFETLDLLSRLVERLLVVVDRAAHGNARYRFLESVWRFALARLESHPQLGALRTRHLAAHLALAEDAEVGMTGPRTSEYLAELALEEENLLAALAWCEHAPDGAERGLRLATAANRFWAITGRYATAQRAIEEALARDTARSNRPLRSKALARTAGVAMVLGDHASARIHLEEGLALSRADSDRKGEARSISGLAVVAMHQERFEEALALNEEGTSIYRELGEPRGVAMTLHNQGTIEWALARPDFGRAHLEQALEMFVEAGDSNTRALCLAGLASSLVRLGEPEAARQRLLECLKALEEVKAPRESTYALDAIAEWLLAMDRPREAARFCGTTARTRIDLRSPLMPHERKEYDAMLARIAARLGPAEGERELAHGRQTPLAQAMTDAARALNEAP